MLLQTKHTAVDDVVDRSAQLPGEVPEESEHGETGEKSGEEIHQRHEDRLAVKQNARGNNIMTRVFKSDQISNIKYQMKFICPETQCGQ